MSAANWMILTACLVALPASLLGVLLISRKMVMVADAISHAVLPGIVVAYLFSGSRDSIPMLIGAAITGFLTTYVIHLIHTRLRIKEDAAIGATFTFFFALGVLLIALFTGMNSDLDQDCVLYGDIETSVLDQVIRNNRSFGTVSVLKLLPLNILVLIVVIVGYRGWKIWAFNPEFGKVLGLKINVFHAVLLMLLSIHAVLSFESVGVILVIGLLVFPASISYLFSKNLKQQLIYSACIGIISCVLGVHLGIQFNVSVSPLIVVVNGMILLIVLSTNACRLWIKNR